MASLEIIEKSTVSPPKGSVPDTTIPLSVFDLLWLYNGAVERLFFYKYPHSTSHFVHHDLQNLKSSLSLSLQHFYLLAGRVVFLSDSDHKFEYHYSDGDSVSFALAESEADFEELSGNQARSSSKLLPLIPTLALFEDPMPLMAIQVTVFPNHGISIGLTINHGACDGSSTTNFVKSWAATCCTKAATSAKFTAPPLYDRSLLVYSSHLYALFLNIVLQFREMRRESSSSTVTTPSEDLVLATFSLRREQIEKLKRWILSDYQDSEGSAPFHCSTFAIGCAVVWTCLVSARGWPSDRTAFIGFPVDARERLQPPVPNAYFGNCIAVCLAESKVEELGKDGGIRAAAEAIGRTIDGLKQGILKDADGWPKMGRRVAREQPLTIAGSPKFRLYETDFGWGKPVKVEVLSIRRNGAMSLAEHPEEQGGLQFGLALPKKEIDAFAARFAGAVQVD